MRKQFLGTLTILLLLLFVLPLAALASEKIIINSIPTKAPGDSVKISGQTVFNEVSIKVIRPDATVLYVDVTNAVNGSYSITFTLPGDAQSGTYTVVVGQGLDVAKGTILVGEKSDYGNNGGGGGSGGSAPAGQTVTGTGGRITGDGVVIDIPAGAVNGQIRVTVERITDILSLPALPGASFVNQVFDIKKDRTGNFEKPITVTIPFEKSKVDAGKYDLKICWLDESTGEWIELDSISVDLAAGEVSGKTNHFTKFAVIAFEKATATVLRDISGHWAESTIKQMVDRGVTRGYPDGTFKPDNNITRAEFAVLLVKAFKLGKKDGKIFADTANHWAKDDIATAASEGIVGGYDVVRFGPDDLITREQMASMIVRAKKLPVTEESLSFADTGDISAWAKNALATATKYGLINGYPDNTVRPIGNATRAEAVTVIYNTLK